MDALYDKFKLDKKANQLAEYELKIKTYISQNETHRLEKEMKYWTQKIEDINTENTSLEAKKQWATGDQNPLMASINKTIRKNDAYKELALAKRRLISTMKKEAKQTQNKDNNG